MILEEALGIGCKGTKETFLVLKLMPISREADYAIRVILELAGRPSGAVVRRQEIAEQQGVPRPMLGKVVKVLNRAGLVRTLRGAGGGVSLGHPAQEITLRAAIEAVDGPILLNRCLLGPGVCPRDTWCRVHPILARLQAGLRQELDGITMAALAVRGGQRSPDLGGSASC